VAAAFIATPTMPPLVTAQVLRPVMKLFSFFQKILANTVVLVCGKASQIEVAQVEYLDFLFLG